MSFTIEKLIRLINKRDFCILGTQGKNGPHVSGVSFFADGLDLYILTGAKTAKARNLRRNKQVAVNIPVPFRLIPAPMRSIQFRGTGEFLPIDDSNANRVLDNQSFFMRRGIKKLLDEVDVGKYGENIWIRIRPTGKIETFMVGVPLSSFSGDMSGAVKHYDTRDFEKDTE